MSKWTLRPDHLERYASMISVTQLPTPPGVVSVNLGHHLWAIFDKADLDIVLPYSWHLKPSKTALYAVRTTHEIKSGRKVFMHRHLMKPGDRLIVDHINGNTLDNRRCNLRICTNIDNCHNLRVVRGVRQHRTKSGRLTERWRAVLNGRNLGLFDTQEDAIAARRAAEVAAWGSYAHTA